MNGVGGGEQASVWTIGHSNRPLDHLLTLLQASAVEVLVDTRSQPYSRVAPQFARGSLERALSTTYVRYVFMGDTLGGRPSDAECYVDGKIDYDRVECQDFYQQAIGQLVDMIGRARVCLLCSEEDPARCHRRLLIGRSLLRHGIKVLHIRRDGTVEPDESTDGKIGHRSSDGLQLQLL